MPYPVNDGAILEVTIRGELNAQTTLSVFHYRLTDSLGLPDGDAAITAFDAEFNDATDFTGAYIAATSQDWHPKEVVYQWIYPIRYRRTPKPLVSLVSQIASGCDTPQLAGVLVRQADLAGRHGRGALHMPGICREMVLNGFIVGTQLTKLQEMVPFMRRVYRTGTMFPILFNRAAPVQSRTITSAYRPGTLRVVRRRTVGVGI